MCKNSAKRVDIVSLKVVKECSLLYGNRKISSPSDAVDSGRIMLEGSDREKLLLCYKAIIETYYLKVSLHTQ